MSLDWCVKSRQCAFIIAFVSLLAQLSHQVSPNLIAMAGKLTSTSVRLYSRAALTQLSVSVRACVRACVRGNSLGSAAPHSVDANCSNDCRSCGASTHWKCCGNPDENASFCKAFSKESYAKAATTSRRSWRTSEARERLLTGRLINIFL